MREIKFRAWMDGNMFMPDVIENEAWELAALWLSVNQIRFMQFTGLKDRNGVDIYESDIVNYHFVDDHLSCTVMWNEEMCCFGFKDKGEDVIYGVNTDDVSKRAVVIGNIYENTDLLKDES